MWLFVLTMVTATAKAEFDYCTITKKHTMCQSDQGFGDKCGTVLGSGITNQDRQEMKLYKVKQCLLVMVLLIVNISK